MLFTVTPYLSQRLTQLTYEPITATRYFIGNMVDQIIDTVANHDVKLIAEAVSEQVRYQIVIVGSFIMILMAMIGYFMKEAWGDMKSDVKQIMKDHTTLGKQHNALHTQVQLIGQQVNNNGELEKIMTTLAAMGSREPLDNENEE